MIDIEYTNALPAVFAQDPPLWLLGVDPDKYLERDFFPWFLKEYESWLEQFLAAMRRVEAKQQQQQEEEEEEEEKRPLSALMRKSWESKRCWFNYGVHAADCVDAIYWAVLCDLPGADAGPGMEDEVKAYQAFTKGQIAAYEKQRTGKDSEK